MKTNTFACLALLFFGSSVASADTFTSVDTFGSGANTFDIDFVTIGDPGNDADVTGDPNPAGKVDYTYRMGKFEISEDMINKANAQDALGITHDNRGANKPATSISWYEAARFVNWLNVEHDSTPAYKFNDHGLGEVFQLWGPGDTGYTPKNPFRNSKAKYFLPSMDEWYKAAYYDPTAGVYYNYPTGSNDIPDGIDFVGDAAFDVVFADGVFNPDPNDIMDAGLLSPYGTMGQGGNVWEWEETESDLVNDLSSSARGVRGSDWSSGSNNNLQSSARFNFNSDGASDIGFRVASVAIVVPEPSTLSLLFLAGLLAVPSRRKKVGLRSLPQ